MDRPVTPPQQVTSPTWGPPDSMPQFTDPTETQAYKLTWRLYTEPCLTSLQPIAPHLSAANLRDYPPPDVHVRVETGSSYSQRTGAVVHSEDELVPLPSKQKEWSRQGCLPLTQTRQVEILCIKRGIMLQTRKSLITEVRGRTGGAHPLPKPPGWESCAQT